MKEPVKRPIKRCQHEDPLVAHPTLSELLKAIRVSRRELCAAAGLSEGGLSNVLRGRAGISKRVVERMADYLDVAPRDVEQLITMEVELG